MIRELPRLGLQLWIVLFILFFGAEVVHLEPGLRVVTQVLYAAPLVVWACLRLRGPRDVIDWAVVGLIGAFGVVAAFSRDPTESFGALGLATAYAAWFLLIRRVPELRPAITLAIATGLSITLALNAYLLVQEKLASFAELGAARFEGLATFPWESVNALPMLVLVAIPFLAWIERGWIRATLTATVAIAGLIVVPLSLGRAGWLGLAVCATVGILLAPGTSRLVRRLARPHRLALGAGVIVIGAAAAVLIGPRFVTAVGDSGRLLLWEQGLNLLGRSPLIGYGQGTFSWVRLEAPPIEASQLPVRLIHNAPLQTLVDGGLVLGASMLIAVGAWARDAWSRRIGWSLADRAAVASAVGFAAALSLDDFSYLPAITAVVLTMAAFLAPAPIDGSPGVRRYLLPAVLGVAALVATPNVIAVDVARSIAQSARAAMVGADYGEAAADFSAATRWHPALGGYWLGLGMAQAYAGNVESAVDAYRRATDVARGDPRGYAALAGLVAEDERADLLQRATELSLGDADYAVRLGLVLGKAGRPDEAAISWGRAVALHPDLLRALPYTEVGTSIEEVAAAAVGRIHADRRPSPASDRAALWEIELALDELSPDAGPAWLAVDAARHGDVPRATQLASDAVNETPWLPQGYQAQAAVAAFACDPEAERQALELAERAGDSYGEPWIEPQIYREFVYREASLGPSQPPGARVELEVERWPWSLIERPADCNSP